MRAGANIIGVRGPWTSPGGYTASGAKSRAKPGGPTDRRSWTAERLLEWGSLRDPDRGCLIWQRSKTTGGYGNVTYQGVQTYTHRLAWEAANGRPVPAGMCVCHRCDVRNCVEPSHLFIGTIQDNVADMVSKRRHQWGERSASAKLSTEDVAAIRALDATITVIGRRFGVNATYVAEIRRGEKRRLG